MVVVGYRDLLHVVKGLVFFVDGMLLASKKTPMNQKCTGRYRVGFA
jgi:hypothetical protein